MRVVRCGEMRIEAIRRTEGREVSVSHVGGTSARACRGVRARWSKNQSQSRVRRRSRRGLGKVAGGRYRTYLRAFYGNRFRGDGGWGVVTSVVVSALVRTAVAIVPVVAPITAGTSRPRPRTVIRVACRRVPVVAAVIPPVIRPAAPVSSIVAAAMVARPIAVAPVIAPVVTTHRARRSDSRRQFTPRESRVHVRVVIFD